MRGVAALLLLSTAIAFEKFDDSALYRINWDSDIAPELKEQYDDLSQGLLPKDPSDAVLIRTLDNENYACTLPKSGSDNKGSTPVYTGSSPGQLMAIYHKARSCTYRTEMYWAYELCHGRFIRQYHEEKLPNSKIKLQEYYLGQYMSDVQQKYDQDFDSFNPPKKKIEDQLLPYYPVRYESGTICDLSNTPRVTTVLYVCIPGTREFMHSISEISSCEYEVIFFTSILCKHPAFKPPVPPENEINCFPLHASPERPLSLARWEADERKREEERGYNKVIVGVHDKYGTVSLKTAQSGAKSEPKPTQQQPQEAAEPPPIIDKSLADSFLAGDYCLYGGSGWWKHEYCHGRQVIQFHEDPKTGKRTEVLLGIWNEHAHLAWLNRNPLKRPQIVGQRVAQVSYLYSNGDFCDLSGTERWTEVRLKCRQSAGSPNAVTLYLMEPKSCEYILVVESAMFCEVLQTVDTDGMFEVE